MIDAQYAFGRPKIYLSTHELARLEILKGKLEVRREQLDRPTFDKCHRRLTPSASIWSPPSCAD